MTARTPASAIFTGRIDALLDRSASFGGAAPTIRQVMADLETSGVRVWLSGGAVRDALVGRPPNDLDLTVSCHAEDLRAHLVARYGPRGVLIFNPGFGTLRFGTSPANYLDFSMLRDPADVVGHAHFKQVRYRLGTSLEADARNRDFPFNALFWRDGLIDPTGRGVADALARRLSICQDPRKSAIDPRLSFRILHFEQLGYGLQPDAIDYLAQRLEGDILAMAATLRKRCSETTAGPAATSRQRTS